jgi:hypothetical protein
MSTTIFMTLFFYKMFRIMFSRFRRFKNVTPFLKRNFSKLKLRSDDRYDIDAKTGDDVSRVKFTS